jgi:hypothetical protein
MARAFSARSRCWATASTVVTNEIFATRTRCESITDERHHVQTSTRSTAVLVDVPAQRLADAMLVLELKGFPDVMAFHSEPGW